MIVAPPRHVAIAVLIVAASAHAAPPATCAVPEPDATKPPVSTQRSVGAAHVKLHGDGLDVDLPSQRAMCGAFFYLAAGRAKAGDGLLFATCTPQGFLRVRNDNASHDVDTLAKHVQVEFVTNDARYGSMAPVTFTPSKDRKSATLSGTLGKVQCADPSKTTNCSVMPFEKTAKLDVNVTFDCTKPASKP